MKGDLLAVFDNKHVLQHWWKISLNNTVNCSVITMVIFLGMDEGGALQEKQELKPDNWMHQLTEGDRTKVKYIDQDPDICKTKYTHYHQWLTQVINEVAQEQQREDNLLTDAVDERVNELAKQREYKTCPNVLCGFDKVPKRARVCPNCHGKVVGTQMKQDAAAAQTTMQQKDPKEVRVVISRRADNNTYSVKYEPSCTNESRSHLNDVHPEQPPEVFVGAPVLVNPCSFEAVATVFRDIGRQGGIKQYGGQREWMTVVCDGLPYILGCHVIKHIHTPYYKVLAVYAGIPA